MSVSSSSRACPSSSRSRSSRDRVGARELLARELGAVALAAGALHRVANRARDQVDVGTPLHEVVLRARMHRVERQAIVVDARQHHDRHERRRLLEGVDRLDAGRVRQVQVEQQAAGAARRHVLERVGQLREMRDRERPVAGRMVEHRLDRLRVVGAVLDEDDLAAFVCVRGRHPSGRVVGRDRIH